VDEGDREYVNGGRKSESRFCFAKADFVKNILRRFRKKSKKTNKNLKGDKKMEK
jgi:hypothetical protein